MDINSLRSMCCKKYNSSRIPSDLNETSTMARYAPTRLAIKQASQAGKP